MKNNELIVLGEEKRRREKRLWIIVTTGLLVIVAAATWFLSQWNYKRTHQVLPLTEKGTTLSPALQHVTDSLLREKMTEIDAIQGQVIVVEVKTGAIKAITGLERHFDGQLQPCDNFFFQQEQGWTMMTASLLAAMETGNVDENSCIDTGSGIFFIGEPESLQGDLDEHVAANSESVIVDHNWRRGGYGELTLEQTMLFASDIGVSRLTWNAFDGDDRWFFDKLDSMSFGQPDRIEGIKGLKPMTCLSSPRDSNWVSRKLYWHAIGHERKMAPIQMLTFYNAIANDGRMVKPTFIPDSTEVINESIASIDNIKKMRWMLNKVVTDGLSKKATALDVRVAGMTGRIIVENDYEYNVSFCGFFPVAHPRYSIIVSMNKYGLPASGGGQAAPVFSKIVNYMTEKGMVEGL